MVEFKLEKLKKVWWERLLREKARQHWLRVDFQNWKDEEDVGDEKEPFEEVSGQCKHCKNIRLYLSQALIIIICNICIVCVGCILQLSLYLFNE